MTTWQFVRLIASGFFEEQKKRLDEYLNHKAEMMMAKKIEEIKLAKQKEGDELFVCFSGELKDRIEWIQLMTKEASLEHVIYNALDLYARAVKRVSEGCSLYIVDESSGTANLIKIESLYRMPSKLRE